ncbi:hypothetical protein SBA2_1140003 [Acidobacteriia bacterium SbA2]|nr:hypothetical protein SBA2_1140003 [Acidobacteriia bacterium SbA2]
MRFLRRDREANPASPMLVSGAPTTNDQRLTYDHPPHEDLYRWAGICLPVLLRGKAGGDGRFVRGGGY